MNRIALVIAAVGLTLGCGIASAQPTMTYSALGSTVTLDSRARADNFRIPNGTDFHRIMSVALETNYAIGQSVYERGTSVNPISIVSGPGASTTDSAAAYVGVNGLNTSTVAIDYRAVTLGSSSGTSSYAGSADASVSCTLAFDVHLNGSPAGSYALHATWNYTSNAGTSSEDPSYEDSASAGGRVMVAPGNQWEMLYDAVTQSAPSDMPRFQADHGVWDAIVYIPEGGATVYVSLEMGAGNGYSAPGVGQYSQDMDGSEFIGGMTLTVSGGGAAPCVADVDDGSGTGTPDGGVTIDDLLYFLAIFAAGDVRADVDDGSGTGTPDGGVTIDDLLYFLARFTAGC